MQEYKFNRVIVYGDVKQAIQNFQKKLDEVALSKIKMPAKACKKEAA